MNKSIVLLLALLFAACSVSLAQTNIKISDTPGVSYPGNGNNFEIDCSAASSETGTTIFFYDSGLNGNYSTNESYIRELSSTNGGSISVKFTQFNLATGTLLTIKDAISQEILVSNATGTTLNGQTFTSNRGSLQFVWTSGTSTGAGFRAKVWCGAMCQAFNSEIVPSVSSTTDAGDVFYDVCPNSAVSFNANTTFLNNDAPGGYHQDLSTLTYQWGVMFMNDTTYFDPIQGASGSSFSYTFPNSGGYYVFCNVSDQNGCLNRNYNTIRVRVSVLPTWEEVSFGPDNVCPGTEVSFTGAPTAHDWAYRPPQVIAGATFLPDGNSTCYSTSLVFENVFPEGSTLTNVNDILRIYLNMEHSYLGDLSIMLKCPSGQNCLLHAYSGGTMSSLNWTNVGGTHTAGSSSGGNIHLGLAPDPYSTTSDCYYTAGEGYAYNFTPQSNTPFGPNGPTTTTSYTDPCGNTESNSVLDAGDYGTYENMSSLIGCPLNGTWTIYVCDHLGSDNGWIFEWGLFFRDDLYLDNLWHFENTFSSTTYLWNGENMTSAPGSGTATAVVQNPDQHNASLIPYTFQATDNFGCTYDTTVAVNVLASLDPSCCIQPTPHATAGNTAPCSNSTTLSVGGFSMDGNTGEWTYTSAAGGTASFTAPNSPTTSVSVNVYGDYTFTWHEYYQGNTSCTGESSVNVNFARLMDATLDPVGDLCRSNAMVTLSAQDFGTLTCTPATNAFNAEARTFTPGLATPGTYTIRNQINNERCADPATSTVSFAVNAELVVTLDDPICNTGNDPTVTLNFHIGSNAPGAIPTYRIGYTYTENEDDTDPNNIHTYNDTLRNQHGDLYTLTAPSALEYSFAFIDDNGCSNIRIPGYFACACPNYSGAFADYSARIRCTGESIELGHDHQQEVDEENGGVFSFVVCTDASDIEGSYVCTLPASTTSVSKNDIPNSAYNRQYYIVAVAGYGYGIAAWSAAGCRSVSRPIPFMWKETPQPTATGGATCGRVITLEGSDPEGMRGYWTASAEGIANYSYTTINGTDNTMYNATVFSNSDGPVQFVWHVVNDECTGESAPATYDFQKVPTPEAGYDRTVCGLSAEILGANATQPPIDGALLSWNAAGVIMTPPNGIQPVANANGPGTYTITLTERNGNCAGSDDVRITFIDVPAPVTTSNVDTVCGHTAELQVYNSNPLNGGHWTAYDMQGRVITAIYRAYGNPGLPSSDTFPHCFTSVEIPSELTEVEYEFRWSEPVNDPRIPAGEECIGIASKHVVFRKMPSISVYECNGTDDFTTVCGRTVSLCADTHASDGFASYMWLNKDINGRYSDSLSNQTTFTLDSMYTITRYMDVPFYFTARNGNCMAIDTMNVRFLELPKANAGNDNAVCGNYCELAGDWGIPASDSYTPQCQWTCLSAPNDRFPSMPTNTNSISIPVTAAAFGIHTFEIREINTAGEAGNCFSTDTVTIEFIQPPSVYAGPDQSVCGLDFTMAAVGSHVEGDSITGSWTCITGGQAAFDDRTDPTTSGHYSAYGPADFLWIETNRPHIEVSDPITCSAYDTVRITFIVPPTARINMNAGDTIVCGLQTDRFPLRADQLGSGVSGMWTQVGASQSSFSSQYSNVTDVEVFAPGRYYYQWIAYSGPNDMCRDTSDVWFIDFIKKPVANIVLDSALFCASDGQLQVSPITAPEEGVWSANVATNILWFDDPADPNTGIHTRVLNSENPNHPYYMLYWHVQNTRFCSAQDSVKVVFASIPSDSIILIPPKCFGEAAVLTAYDTTLVAYDWDYGNGVLDSVVLNAHSGQKQIFIHWDDKSESHVVGLVTTNRWRCPSNIGAVTVNEPALPEYHYNIIQDTCSLGRGGVEFLDTTGIFSFYWTDTTPRSENAVGPDPVTGAISYYHVYRLPAGIYSYRSEYSTFNREYQIDYLRYFGSYSCEDRPSFEIGTIGMIEAEFAVAPEISVSSLVAPDAQVLYVNTTNYDNIGKKCEWHYGDGNVERNCDELVEHIYAEPGCYEPFLVVMNRDLPECRDTAYLDIETPQCAPGYIYVDRASLLEVPNIFSPNGDGVNDYFQVHAQTLKKFSGKIVNRYGRVVYEWTDWENMESGWDGRLNGTTKATPGVYYYIIEAEGYDGMEYNPSGPLHLVR